MEKGMQKVHDFLKKAGTYYLATVDGNLPRVRPFGTINYFEGKLYIQTGVKKDIVKQITANPNAEICAYDGETWIRIAAVLIADDNVKAKESMLEAYPFLKTLYTLETSIVYYLKDVIASFFTMGGEPETVKF